jgi:hypothetical protein
LPFNGEAGEYDKSNNVFKDRWEDIDVGDIVAFLSLDKYFLPDSNGFNLT